MKRNQTQFLAVLFVSVLTLSACGAPKPATFSDDADTGQITPLVDKSATDTINITKTLPLNEEFKVEYKTFNPNGVGNIQAKAKSVKIIDMAGKKTPSEGKKLVLVEIAVIGNTKNKGEPATFNQIGETPSPQFVMLDRLKNSSLVETTYYSDGYTEDKKLFELSKITLDHEQWINTALVFEVDKDYNPDLAFRFTSATGKTEFYAISSTTK